MKHDHFVVQQPESAAKQLLLFFHGVGDNPANMGQIASYFAPLFPEALIVSVGG
jgi:phospholipase/carboxylesterase